jgi:four helix bundle protein
MPEIRSFRDLIAWQKSFQVGLTIYEITKSFPESERFGLIAQLRRAAVSVASNIAEGYGRQSTSDHLRFLRIARGGLYEIETQLLFATHLEFITAEVSDELVSSLGECGRVLAGLIRSLEQSQEVS